MDAPFTTVGCGNGIRKIGAWDRSNPQKLVEALICRNDHLKGITLSTHQKRPRGAVALAVITASVSLARIHLHWSLSLCAALSPWKSRLHLRIWLRSKPAARIAPVGAVPPPGRRDEAQAHLHQPLCAARDRRPSWHTHARSHMLTLYQSTVLLPSARSAKPRR